LGQEPSVFFFEVGDCFLHVVHFVFDSVAVGAVIEYAVFVSNDAGVVRNTFVVLPRKLPQQVRILRFIRVVHYLYFTLRVFDHLLLNDEATEFNDFVFEFVCVDLHE